MKRAEVATLGVLFAALLAVGGFVGVQVWRAPRRAQTTTAVADSDSAAATARTARLASPASTKLFPASTCRPCQWNSWYQGLSPVAK